MDVLLLQQSSVCLLWAVIGTGSKLNTPPNGYFNAVTVYTIENMDLTSVVLFSSILQNLTWCIFILNVLQCFYLISIH